MTPYRSRKPLMYWCRWHNATLRLRGKDDNAVWGEFAYDDGEVDRFHFNLETWKLRRWVDDAETEAQLDEMGVERDIIE